MSESDKRLKEIDDYSDFMGGQGNFSIYFYEWKTIVTIGNDITTNYHGRVNLGKEIENNKNFLYYSVTSKPRNSMDPYSYSLHEFAHIYPSKKLYLKLDNGEILTLTCSVHNLKPIDVNRKTIVYEDESYFSLTDSQIKKLFSHRVIKMRADVASDDERTNICEYQIINYNNPRAQFENEYKRIKKERKDKSDLDENPLKDF